jgi:hypothetical protein
VKEAPLAAGINSSSPHLFRFQGFWETTPTPLLHLPHSPLASWAITWVGAFGNRSKRPTRAVKTSKEARLKSTCADIFNRLFSL